MHPGSSGMDRTYPQHLRGDSGAADFRGDPSSETVPDRFARVAEACGPEIAIMDHDRVTDFATLYRTSEALAARLCETGPLRPRVAILHGNKTSSIASIFAVARAGGVSANLSLGSPPDYVRHQFNLFRPDLVISDRDSRQRYRYEPAHWLEDPFDAPNEAVRPPIHGWPQLHPDDPIGVNFTSGTTGLPKAVERSHRTALQGVDGFARSCAIAPGERVVFFDPLSFAGGRGAAVWTLLNGASLGLFPLQTAGVQDLVAWLLRTRPTFLKTTPTVFRHLLHTVGAEPLRDALAQLRILGFEGEPCRPGDVAAFQAHGPEGCLLRLTYSATEFGNAAQCFISKEYQPDDRGIPSGFINPGYHIEQGPPAPGTEDLAHGEDGTGARVLHLRGAGVVQGYVGAPEQTRQHFLPSDERGHPGFVTYDRGFVGEDGLLFVTGRQDAMLKLRGFRLSPAEIEDAICRLLPVLQAAVTVSTFQDVATDESPERLVAHIVMADGEVCDRRAFRARLGQVLPPQAIPQFFLPADHLPAGPNGKVDRAALPALTTRNAVAGFSAEAPLPGTETMLAQIWKQTLRVDPIGRHDAFEDLGGDSLGALQVVLEIEAAFGRPCPATLLLECPTIAALAARLDDPDDSTDPVLQHLRAGSGARLMYITPIRGDTLQFVKIIRHLPADTDVWGLQGRPLAREDPSLPSDIARLVEVYVDRIMALPPRRPLVLVGFSYGGLVAFELARALEARRIEVDRVVLLDTFGPACRRLVFSRGAGFYVSKAASQPLFEAARWFRDSLRMALRLSAGRVWSMARRAFLWGERRRWFVSIAPQGGIVLGPTKADLVLIRADDSLSVEGPPDYGWAALTTGAFHILWGAGAHGELLDEANGPRTGGLLKGLLNQKER